MESIRTVTPVLLVVLLAHCGPSPDVAREANKDLVRQFAATVNAADWDGLNNVLSVTFRRHSQATGTMPEMEGIEAFKQLQEGFAASMPDQKVTIDVMVAEGDYVATYGAYSGTMTGPLGDLPATGAFASVPFFSLFRIESGRIAELWVEWDNIALLTQLGLFPPPPPEDVM